MAPNQQHAIKPYIIGLTGGIASGKSTVGQLFTDLGVPVCDADQIARNVVAAGSDGLTKVVTAFGTKALLEDGNMNRAWLRKQVFANPDQRKTLEGIIHPLVRQGLLDFIQAATTPYIILEVPLLIEGGLDQLCDRVLVVDIPHDIQIARLQARDGSTAEQAQQILDAQTSREQRLAKADEVLNNDHSLDKLKAQILPLHNLYLQLAAESAQ